MAFQRARRPLRSRPRNCAISFSSEVGDTHCLERAVIGTAAFTLLEEVFWANFLDYNRAILGAVIVILIFFLPGGLLAISYRDIAARIARLSRLRKAAA